MKVALVHDWGNQMGGAECVLEALKDLFPDAAVYMSIYDPARMPAAWRQWGIRTSFMDRLPGVYSHHQMYVALFPRAFEQFSFSGYDLVISSKSGFCHGILTPPQTLHICYCHTTTRFLWDFANYAARERIGGLKRALLGPTLSRLRVWDRIAADRVDEYVANSTEVQRRIRKFYRREAVLIPPPVATGRFRADVPREDFFLVVSRLIPYKRIDLAVTAFNQLGLPLKVVGDGRDRGELQKLARPNIQFLGRRPNEEVTDLFQRARGFIFPGCEDFGITPLEANAAGCPVVAFRAGGALDTVVEGTTGVFFDEPTAESLAQAVRTLQDRQFDPGALRSHALRFDTEVFQREMLRFVEQKLAAYRESAGSAGAP